MRWGRQFWRQAGFQASAGGKHERVAWKGRLPPKLAAPQGRMNHPIYRISAFEIVANYTLRIRFNDESEQTIDFRPILAGDSYGPLRDLEVFNQVRLDPEVHTLVWSNGADFDPATLHDWPENEAAFRELALQWQAVQA
jgi:hypothetical protein